MLTTSAMRQSHVCCMIRWASAVEPPRCSAMNFAVSALSCPELGQALETRSRARFAFSRESRTYFRCGI